MSKDRHDADPVKLLFSIEETDIINGSLEALSSVRPSWSKDKIKFKVFTDGITNKLVGCFYEDQPDDVILVRVYGQKTDLLIDRHAETRNIKILHAAGYAPRLYATFNNGLVYEYVPGEVLTTDLCRDVKVYPLVARMLANMHKLDCGNSQLRTPSLWTKTRQFLDNMPTKFEDPEQQAKFQELIPPRSKLEEELEELKSCLSTSNSPIVFCHNDLLLGNVIYNSEKNTVTFIDYEYASYNYQAFDIGNHFAEFAGVTDLDYSLYPDASFQRDWLKVYLEAFHEGEKSFITERHIDKLYIQVNKFSLMTHIIWAVWALIQAEHSTIDFDFLGYSSARLKEYYAKKDKFLSLSIPDS